MNTHAKYTENEQPIPTLIEIFSDAYIHDKLTTTEIEILMDCYNRKRVSTFPSLYSESPTNQLALRGYITAIIEEKPLDEFVLTPKGYDWIKNFEKAPIQTQITTWAYITFRQENVLDRKERGFRFCEEALELVQAVGIDKEDIYALIDYVYARPKGDKKQEIGGVLTTLAVLASVHDLDLDLCAKDELKRIWLRIDQIRAKQQNKPTASPLPGVEDGKI